MLAIKVYGERNSGTNYLEQLIELNLDVALLKYKPAKTIAPLLKYEIMTDLLLSYKRPSFLGWKHGCPPLKHINSYPGKLLIITLTKNPYSFLLSLHNKPYHYKGTKEASFLQFIKSEWKTILRDHLKLETLSSPMALWNRKNESYYKLITDSKHPVVQLTYEELLANPEKFIHQLAKDHKIPLKTPIFQNKESSTKESSQRFSNYQDFYLNDKWKEQLTPEVLSIMNDGLDHKLMKQFGYPLL